MQLTENPLPQFMAHCAESARLTQLLREFIDDHMNVDSERMHWAHVGDAAHLSHSLAELATHFKLDHRSS